MSMMSLFVLVWRERVATVGLIHSAIVLRLSSKGKKKKVSESYLQLSMWGAGHAEHEKGSLPKQ